MPGKFITIEGIDGAGKSSAREVVITTLENAGFEAVPTREIGGTDMGEAIRELVLSKNSDIVSDAEVLLMFAARIQHLEQVIYPNLEAGRWVVCDRFTDSTYAYQGGGRSVGASRIAEIEQWTQGSFRPDLTLLFDVGIETAQHRIKQIDDLDRFEIEAQDFHSRVRTAYLNIAKSDPDRVKQIDATESVENVRHAVQKHVQNFIDQVNGLSS